MKTFFITGVSGFIGFHVAKRLLEMGDKVIGVDNFDEYYSVVLKKDRVNILEKYDNFVMCKGDLMDVLLIDRIFLTYSPEYVMHFAAQDSDRYSIDNPRKYLNTNIISFFNLLESAKEYKIKHLMYASSSSLYGSNNQAPFNEEMNTDHPLTIYATTKKTNELMAYTYSHQYKVPTTGLRLYTVYGPYGRPDMLYYKTLDNYFNNEEVSLYCDSEDCLVEREFIYIDDLVESIVRLIDCNCTNIDPYQVIDIGNNNSIRILEFVKVMEERLAKILKKDVNFNITYNPINRADVVKVGSISTKLKKMVDYTPSTPIEVGIDEFIKWYLDYHKIKN